MAQGIRHVEQCAISDCDKPRKTREWCAYHYMRWYRHGDPLAPVLKRPRGSVPCDVEDCDESAFAKGLCRFHYQRQYLKGSLEPKRCLGCGSELSGRGSHEYCGIQCRPICAIAECHAPGIRANGTLCLGHHAQKIRYGVASPFRFRWSDPRPCIVCGDQPARGFRNYCSRACFGAHRKYGDEASPTGLCVLCGDVITYLTVGEDGVKRFRIRFYCKPCRKRACRYPLNVRQLAARDGATCQLCCEPVDMDLKKSDANGLMCPSVDHIVPRSRGGSNSAENLQLAHLICNIRKHNRVADKATIRRWSGQ